MNDANPRQPPRPKTPSNDLIVWECNIRGIKSKHQSLKMIIAAHVPDAVVLCETHLKDGQTCGIPGYRNFYHGRSTRHGGGILIAVHHTVAHQAVLVHKGEAEVLVVRLGHTTVPVTVIAVYGRVGATRDQSDAEWDEIQTQFQLAKARGDLAVIVGDLNRQVGDYIPNNKITVDHGGQVVRQQLDQKEMILLNADREKVTGGPATWVRPGILNNQQSALDLWIACADLAPKVSTLEIDTEKDVTPYRVTRPGGRTKITYTDHRTTRVTIKGINRPPKEEKYKAWSWKDLRTGDWARYAESSRRAAPQLRQKIERIVHGPEEAETQVENIDKAVQKAMNKLAYQHFKKVTVKTGGKKEEKTESPENEPEEILKSRLDLFRAELDNIAREGAHVGQIYKLREVINGNKKSIQQTPAAVKDPETGREIFDVEGIKDAVNRHVQNTLRDLEPAPRYEELAAQRTGIIATAANLDPGARMTFTEEDMVTVLGEMRKKNKNCHHPVTKLGGDFLKVLLTAYNTFAEKQRMPESFNETSLTMLKRTKAPVTISTTTDSFT